MKGQYRPVTNVPRLIGGFGLVAAGGVTLGLLIAKGLSSINK